MLPVWLHASSTCIICGPQVNLQKKLYTGSNPQRSLFVGISPSSNCVAWLLFTNFFGHASGKKAFQEREVLQGMAHRSAPAFREYFARCISKEICNTCQSLAMEHCSQCHDMKSCLLNLVCRASEFMWLCHYPMLPCRHLALSCRRLWLQTASHHSKERLADVIGACLNVETCVGLSLQVCECLWSSTLQLLKATRKKASVRHM